MKLLRCLATMDPVVNPAMAKDNKYLSQLSKRMLNLEPDTKGTRPLFRLGADSGFRNIGIALGVAWRRLPDFDPTWVKDSLVDGDEYPQNPAPAHILATVYADLVPTGNWDEPIDADIYTSPLLAKYTKNIDDAFDRKLDDLYLRLRQSPTAMLTVVDQATKNLEGKSAILAVQYATEYILQIDSAHHLTVQMIKLIMTPRMRWLWMVPASMRVENQMDQVWNGLPDYILHPVTGKKYWFMGDDYNGKAPVIWYISHLMQALVMQMDVLLFGMARECRLSASKYGLDNEQLVATTHTKHPRIKDPHTFRKQMSVESAIVVLLALGQEELVSWIMCVMKDRGHRAHDVTDAINLVFDSFNGEIRINNYSKADEVKVLAFLEKLERYHDAPVQVVGVNVTTSDDYPFDPAAQIRLKEFIRRERELGQRKAKSSAVRKPVAAPSTFIPKNQSYASKKVSVADRAAALLASRQPLLAVPIASSSSSSSISTQQLSSDDLAGLEAMISEDYVFEVPSKPQVPQYRQTLLQPISAPNTLDYSTVDADGFPVEDDEVLPTRKDRRNAMTSSKSKGKKRKKSVEPDEDLIDLVNDKGDAPVIVKPEKKHAKLDAVDTPSKKRLQKCSDVPNKTKPKASAREYTDAVGDIVVNTNVGGRKYNTYDDDDLWVVGGEEDTDGWTSTARTPSTYSSDKKYGGGGRKSRNVDAFHAARSAGNGKGSSASKSNNKGDDRTMSERMHSFVD